MDKVSDYARMNHFRTIYLVWPISGKICHISSITWIFSKNPDAPSTPSTKCVWYYGHPYTQLPYFGNSKMSLLLQKQKYTPSVFVLFKFFVKIYKIISYFWTFFNDKINHNIIYYKFLIFLIRWMIKNNIKKSTIII
jgi:hypothetical protein